MPGPLKKIKWGILGLGKIAHKFVSDLVNVEDAELLAVSSRDGVKAEKFKNQYGFRQAYGSYEDLARDPDIDIIYIATPHAFHMEHTLLCFHHGKHVLCEKPLAINSAQVQKMVSTAKERNLYLMEAIWTRFFPFMKDIVSLVHDDQLGDLVMIEADFGFKASFDPDGRLFNPKLGGGALLDIGIYPIFLAHALLGKPDRISASANLGSTGVDTMTVMRLEYLKGAYANLHCTLEANTAITARIYGTKRYLEVSSRWHEARKMTLWEKDQLVGNMEYTDDCRGYRYEIEAVHEDLKEGHLQNAALSHQFSLELAGTLNIIRRQIGLQYPIEGE